MIRPISRARDFQRLRASGHTARAGALRIRVLIEPQTEPHLGVAIGRSLGGAVVRNRVRRQLRSIMNGLHRDGELVGGWYLISVDGTPPFTSEDLEHDVRTALKIPSSS